MRPPRKKPPSRVSTPPTLSLGIVLFGATAVLAAAGALVRYYGRDKSGVALRHSPDAAMEIPAPDLELEPAPASSATKP